MVIRPTAIVRSRAGLYVASCRFVIRMVVAVAQLPILILASPRPRASLIIYNEMICCTSRYCYTSPGKQAKLGV
jgi:hypothetical protein